MSVTAKNLLDVKDESVAATPPSLQDVHICINSDAGTVTVEVGHRSQTTYTKRRPCAIEIGYDGWLSINTKF